MTFEIPQLGDAPEAITTTAVPRALERLVSDMAANGFMAETDLRIGTGGVRRLAEKPLHRWWAERGLPSTKGLLPLAFTVVATPDCDDPPPGAARDDMWLITSRTGAMPRAYLHRLQGVAEAFPEFYEHYLATLYFALDSVCYSLKPTDMLRLVKAYWWRGRDNEKLVRSEGYRGVASRRQFDNRTPPITQSPRYNRAALARTPGFTRIKGALAEVDGWMRDPRILRPNAHRRGHPPGVLALMLRWRHGDYAYRILHDHWHFMGQRDSVNHFGAWRVPRGRAAFARMLERVEATARLVTAIERLLDETTWTARGSFY